MRWETDYTSEKKKKSGERLELLGVWPNTCVANVRVPDARWDGLASEPEENHESATRNTQKQQLATLQTNLRIIETKIEIKANRIFMSLMVLLRNERRTAR